MSLKRKATDLAADAAKKPKADGAITSFFSQPKPKPATTANAGSSPPPNGQAAAGAETTQPMKFDKDAWIAKLTPEQKELLKLEIDTLHESWLGALKEEVVSKEFLQLKRFLKQEQDTGTKVFPPPNDIYSWCVIIFRSAALLEVTNLTRPVQVPPHAPRHRQSRHCRSRSLPQSQSSTWPLLLRPSTHARPA